MSNTELTPDQLTAVRKLTKVSKLSELREAADDLAGTLGDPLLAAEATKNELATYIILHRDKIGGEALEPERSAGAPVPVPAPMPANTVPAPAAPSRIPQGEAIKDAKEFLDDAARKSKAEIWSFPLVKIMIPLAEGENPMSRQYVNINGYAVNIRKGIYVDVPEPIAEIVMNRYNQELGHGATELERNSSIAMNEKKQAALG